MSHLASRFGRRVALTPGHAGWNLHMYILQRTLKTTTGRNPSKKRAFGCISSFETLICPNSHPIVCCTWPLPPMRAKKNKTVDFLSCRRRCRTGARGHPRPMRFTTTCAQAMIDRSPCTSHQMRWIYQLCTGTSRTNSSADFAAIAEARIR